MLMFPRIVKPRCCSFSRRATSGIVIPVLNIATLTSSPQNIIPTNSVREINTDPLLLNPTLTDEQRKIVWAKGVIQGSFSEKQACSARFLDELVLAGGMGHGDSIPGRATPLLLL
jgi:hypothetical protein